MWLWLTQLSLQLLGSSGHPTSLENAGSLLRLQLFAIWVRHDLETFQKRLKALDAKVAQEGVILNDARVAALERKKEEEQSKGEIETGTIALTV